MLPRCNNSSDEKQHYDWKAGVEEVVVAKLRPPNRIAEQQTPKANNQRERKQLQRPAPKSGKVKMSWSVHDT